MPPHKKAKEDEGPASQVAQTGQGVGVSEGYLTRPTTTLDLERRQREAEEEKELSAVEDPEQVYAPYATEETETADYVAVSPEYMTHAGVAGQPMASEEGAEKDLEDKLKSGSVVRQKPDTSGYQLDGSGSVDELVTSATSGENFTAEVVDQDDVPTNLLEEESADEPVHKEAQLPAE